MTKCYCQTSTVAVIVLDRLTKKSLAGTKVYLRSKTDYSLLSSTITNSEGKFLFQNVGVGNYSISCFYIMLGERTTFKTLKADLGGTRFRFILYYKKWIRI